MNRFRGIASGLALVSVLGACDENPTGDEPGSVSMLITDAPGDFLRAIVTIERIELMRGDEEDDSTDEGSRIVLRAEPWTGDLLELSNDVDEIVGETSVPGGRYSQLRFIISGGCIEVETEEGSAVYASDGYTECGAATGHLQMPSMAQSGLKVNLPSGFRISGDHRIVLVDFDVAESFGHQAGSSGGWVMHPVIRATEVVMTGSLDVTLTVADSVVLPGTLVADSFMVRLDDEPPIAVVGGVASFGFLVPGSYTLELVAPAGVAVATDPILPLEVGIESSEDEDVSVTITGVL